MNEHRHTNALAGQTSPYLLQHAHNPVNWYPWGDEALALAREQDKPIFLSVGYSTCYWCHVMERESFENDAVAAVLNEHFIAIKVDCEQRPDIDEQYMLATMLMTGRGGWPNSVWLMPDGRPWMAGTYFPRDHFVPLLEKLAALWRDDRATVERQADALAEAIKNSIGRRANPAEAAETAPGKLLADAARRMESEFDPIYGGFGDRPKFPPHGNLQLLLQLLERGEPAAGDESLSEKGSDAESIKRIVTRTLDAMWFGGIHDHVGGGFHRYSTDRRWLLPHFEKMLYDNGQLMSAYADAYRLTDRPIYRRAVEDIFAWLSREMTHPEGGFYSALDSETDGEEGKYYVWTHEELTEVLGADAAARFAKAYNFEPQGNFAEEATGRRTGANIPHLKLPSIGQSDAASGVEEADAFAEMRRRLSAAREARPRPHLDDKVLAAWNGLMISGLARGGAALEKPELLAAADRAADFILNNMVRSDGTLMRSFRDGKAELPGYLDDYAFVLKGLLDLHRATDSAERLAQARRIADEMLSRFEDSEGGGFYFTSEDHPELLIRSKHLLGSGNQPLGNGVAAESLARLARLTGDRRYELAASRTVNSLAGFMAQSPGAADTLLTAQMILDSGDDSEERPAGEIRVTRPPLTLTTDPPTKRIRVGEKFELKVLVEIEPGWHLYGDNPEVAELVAAELSADAGDAANIEKIETSEPDVKQDPVFDRSLKVFERQVSFTLTAAAVKPGAGELRLDLRYQACDRTRCLQPQTVTLAVPLVISDETDR